MGVLETAERNDVADALRRAAELLRASRLPVIGGLGTDIAGAEAAIALAKVLGGVIDHEAGEGLARGSAILQSAGGCPASFGEVRNRADLVVAIGDVSAESGPESIKALFPNESGLPRPGENARELVFVGGVDDFDVPAGISVRRIALGDTDLPTAISVLSAQVAERSVQEGASISELAQLAAKLRKAAFPVLVYSPADLDEPVTHVVLEIVRRLCLKGRAAAFALPARGNGAGVNFCAIWTSGVPVRTRFTEQGPLHDSWLYATKRLVESGEADALLWVEALEGKGANPPSGIPTILLTANPPAKSADVVVEVAAAGRDHDGALFLPHLSGIGVVKAADASRGKPTAAEVLDRLRALFAGEEAK